MAKRKYQAVYDAACIACPDCAELTYQQFVRILRTWLEDSSNLNYTTKDGDVFNLVRNVMPVS